jgi:cephalosporin hydroxylase
MTALIKVTSQSIRGFIRNPRRFVEKLRSIPTSRIFSFFRPIPAPYRQQFRMSLYKWLLYHQESIVFDKASWMGVKALKNPLDAWIYQEIIYEVKPDFVIEIGSFNGGSTLYLANLLDIIGSGSVISIDIDRSRFQVNHPRISVLRETVIQLRS